MKATAIPTALVLLLAAHGAAAQSFPSKPVKIVVPFQAGGTGSAMVLALGHELEAIWGQPVITDNRPGAGGIIGAANVAKAAADGYTLLFAVSSTLTINPSVYKNLPYDPVESFSPITTMGRFSYALVAHPSVRADSLKELVALAKRDPGSLDYGSWGNGSEPHVAVERFSQLAGIKLSHIPYKGVAPVLTDLSAGRIQLGFVGVSAATLLGAGKLKGYAFSGDSRAPLIPALPTFKEQGYDFVFSSWWGLAAPQGTPKEIVDRIYRDVSKVIKDPRFDAKYIQPSGMEGGGIPPAQLAAEIREEVQFWREFVKSTNIHAD